MAPTKKIYFIRHGQSEGNSKLLLQGGDDPLTELGKAQAQAVAQRVLSLNAEVILSSTMSRALDTAKIIAQTTGLPLEERDSLREYMVPTMLLDLPITSPESDAFHTALYKNIHDPNWHHTDEESYYECHGRAMSVIDELKHRKEETIVVVSHGAFMRYILSAMMSHGEPDPTLTIRLFFFMKKENTGISTVLYFKDPELTMGNRWHMTVWNDYSHLDPEHRTMM